jgi:hypothetical protein
MRERLTAAPDHDQSVLAQELESGGGSTDAVRLSFLGEIQQWAYVLTHKAASHELEKDGYVGVEPRTLKA